MNKQARLAVALAMIGLALYMFQANKQPPPAQTPASTAQAAPDPVPVKPPTPTGPGPRDFMVAKQRLDPALISRLTTDLVEVRAIPENIPVPETGLVFKKFEDVEGKVLTSTVEQGEILLRSRFADAKNEQMQKKLRDVIPNGWRAISLDVDAVTGTTGFINQGDIVDIAATYTSGGKQLTRIIIQNVEVLARGNEYRTQQTRSVENRTIRGEGGGGILFTLKVMPEMAVKLAHIVDERGFNRFRLILKNRDDKKELRSVGVLLREVLTDQPRAKLRPGTNEDNAGEVEILRGLALARESSDDQQVGPPPAQGGQGEGQGAAQGGQAPQGAGDLISRIRPEGGGAAPAEPAAPPAQ
jgi:Flp pilus assembly protein CpaB